MDRNNLANAAALITVEIDGTGIEVGKTYTEKATGLTKPLGGRQTGFIWQGSRYPLQVSIPIPDGKPPYRPGTYVLSGALFESGKFQRIEFKGTRDLQLIPVADAAAALTAIAKEEAPASVKAA